jgi:hypothetical protein
MDVVIPTEKARDPKYLANKYENVLTQNPPSEIFQSEFFCKGTKQIQCNILNSLCYSLEFSKYVTYQYGHGVALDEIVSSTKKIFPLMRDAIIFIRENYVSPPGQEIKDFPTPPVSGIWRNGYAIAAWTFLLMESTDTVHSFRQFINVATKERSYLFDLLVKSFIPDYVLANKYTVNKYNVDWTNPLIAALAQPTEKRAAAMAAHMKNWDRLMRRYWPFEVKHLVADFAFEVALAVCAYDIDDSGFNDHPYYPRDLVQYYRSHVRHTRDAWRAEGVGARVDITAPPPPMKADLGKSKRKNFARWVELACDGDTDATESVLEEVGNLRKIKELDSVMCALSENGRAIQADIKDDETLSFQADALTKGLGEFEGPAGPPFGAARCSATLQAFDAWLQSRGYRLVDLDGEDDAWHAVVVKAEHHEEFLALSQKLALTTREPSEIYAE